MLQSTIQNMRDNYFTCSLKETFVTFSRWLAVC